MRRFVIYREDEGWGGYSEQIPGLVVHGRNQAEVIEKLRNALMLYFPCGDCEEERDRGE